MYCIANDVLCLCLGFHVLWAEAAEIGHQNSPDTSLIVPAIFRHLYDCGYDDTDDDEQRCFIM